MENGTYNAGATGTSDRTLASGAVNSEIDNALTLQGKFVGDGRVRAVNLSFDIEVWGANGSAIDPGEAAYLVRLEASANNAQYRLIESFNEGNLISTGQTLTSGDSLFFGIKDGNDPANRTSFSSGVTEVDIPGRELFQLSFDATGIEGTREHLFGIDNVTFRTLAPGDVDGNGIVGAKDIVGILVADKFGTGPSEATWAEGDFDQDDDVDSWDLLEVLLALNGQFPRSFASDYGNPGDHVPDVLIDYTTGEVVVDFAGHTSSSVIIDSAAGIFDGDAPAWDTMGEFRTASANQLSNTMFNGTESGVDSLGLLIKAEFLNRDFNFNNDLTVQLLVAGPDGPVTVEGHVIYDLPEPSTWLLLCFGSLAFMAAARRRVV